MLRTFRPDAGARDKNPEHSPVNPEIEQKFVSQQILHDVLYYAELVAASPNLRWQNEEVDQFSVWMARFVAKRKFLITACN
jgi:hypothetical protein